MGTQLNDIIGKYNTARAQEVAESKVLREDADKALQAALRYQSIAAKKMTLYHKLYSKSCDVRKTHWTSVVKDVCEEIERRTGVKFKDLDSLITFGIRCECPVFAYRNMEDEPVGWLTFTSGNLNDFKLYVDTKEQRPDKYPIGSIGEMNGFNNISVEVESIDQLIEIMFKNVD